MERNWTVIPTDGLSEKDFRELRMKGIGGTDMGAILGLSPWKTPIDVYREKLGMADPVEETKLMRRGRDMEALVARWYEERTGYRVAPGGIVINPDTAPLFGSVDRFVLTNGSSEPDRGLECKTVTIRNRGQLEKWEEGAAPENYKAQVNVYNAVTRLPFDLFASIGIDDERLISFDYDEEVSAALVEIAKDFWRRIETKSPPPPDSTKEYSDYLTSLYPVAKEDIMEVTDPVVIDAVMDLRDIRSQIGTLAERKTFLENIIKNAIGTHLGVIAGGDKITWTSVAQKTTKWKELAAACGIPAEKIAEFTTEKQIRRFNVPRSWGADE